MVGRTLLVALLLIFAAFGAAAQESCGLDAAPKQVEAPRGGGPQMLAVSARPPATATLVRATLELAAPPGITATVLPPPPAFPSRGDVAWTVRIEANNAAPARGDVIVTLRCELATAAAGQTVTRLSLLAVPVTVQSATRALSKLKLRAEPLAEPVSEGRAGTLTIAIENQGDQDLVDAALTIDAPAFLRIAPSPHPLGPIAAGTTQTVSFKVTQTGRAEAGAPTASVSLRARAAGEAAAGTVTVAAPISLSVLGVGDVLKLVQVPSFLLLPGALFLLTCGLIWDLRKPGSEFPLAWTKSSFWLIAVPLSALAAWLYPLVTGWFGPPREYLSAYTMTDVMLVWLGSIAIAVPVYVIAAVINHVRASTATRNAAEDRRQREIADTDDPFTVLFKLNQMQALPDGQVLPVVTITQGGIEQRVLRTRSEVDERCWVVPRATIAAADGQTPDWATIEPALTTFTAAGVDAVLAHRATLRASWTRGDIIARPTLWTTEALQSTGDQLPLIDR